MALKLSEDFGSNETASTEGVWLSLGGEAEVLVARLGNREAQRAYKKMPAAIRRQLEDGLMGNDQATDFLCKFMSDHLLKDWKNLADSDKLIKYSPEAAHKMLKKYRRFRDRIWELANDEDLFNVEVAEDRKNS